VRQTKLSRREREIERALIHGEYVDVDPDTFRSIAQAIVRRRKDAVLNIRMNSQDLRLIKQKAKKLGIKYQTFISEFLHRIAQS
jgi:predicted DNA binding CopG/RHH family protein